MTKDNSISSLRERLNSETQNVSTQAEAAKQSIERQWKDCSRALKKQQIEIEKDIRARARLWLKYFPIWACVTSLLLALIWNGFAWFHGGKTQGLRQEIMTLKASKEQTIQELKVLDAKLALQGDRARALANYDLIFEGEQLFVQMNRLDAYKQKTYSSKNHPTRVLVRVQPK